MHKILVSLLNNFIRRPYNAFFDLLIGGSLLSGSVSSPQKEFGSNAAESSDYNTMRLAFSKVNLQEDDVIVDVGCGKGRLMNFLILFKKFKGQVIGIESNPQVADFARTRLERYQNIKIITADALNWVPDNGTIFYLYHPFSREMMEKFINKIDSSVKGAVTIIYVNDQYRDVIESKNNWTGSRFSTNTIINFHHISIFKRESQF